MVNEYFDISHSEWSDVSRSKFCVFTQVKEEEEEGNDDHVGSGLE